MLIILLIADDADDAMLETALDAHAAIHTTVLQMCEVKSVIIISPPSLFY